MSRHVWKTTLKKSWVYPKVMLVFWLTWNQKKKKKMRTHASPFKKAERASDIFRVLRYNSVRCLKITCVNVVISVWARLARGCLLHSRVPNRWSTDSNRPRPRHFDICISKWLLPGATKRGNRVAITGRGHTRRYRQIRTRYCFCGR